MNNNNDFLKIIYIYYFKPIIGAFGVLIQKLEHFYQKSYNLINYKLNFASCTRARRKIKIKIY